MNTTETRWLNAEEQDTWRLLLGAMRKIARGMDETLQAGATLSTSEFSVLVSLSEAGDDGLRLRQLCDDLEWDRSRTSHQITRMVKRGLVTKEKHLGDGRGVVVRVTPEGLQRLQAAAPEHVESVRRMVFDHLDPADEPALRRFFSGVLAVDNIPGYPGFTPDNLLNPHGREPLAAD